MLGIGAIGQRVGVVNRTVDMVDIEFIGAARISLLVDAVGAYTARGMQVTVHRTQHKRRDGCILVIYAFVFTVAKTRRKHDDCHEKPCQGRE